MGVAKSAVLDLVVALDTARSRILDLAKQPAQACAECGAPGRSLEGELTEIAAALHDERERIVAKLNE